MSKSVVLWIIIGIALIILAFPFSKLDFSKFDFFSSSKEEEVIDSSQALIDSLNLEIKKQKEVRAYYEDYSKRMQDSLSVLRKEFIKDKAKIQQLRNEIQKKRDDVVRMSSDELTRFITDRYRDSLIER